MSPKNLDSIDLATYIEHTLLDPLATEAAIAQCCAEADQWKFPLVCIAPIWVKFAAETLHHKATKVCTVIGFPTGAHSSATKLYEAQEAVDHGAAEIDVVINLGWLKAENSEAVYQDIAAICDGTGIPVKAILETSVLSTAEKKLAAEICLDAGVAFLKTSTGWRGGATVEDVQLLRSVAGDRIGVKASGGIRSPQQALELIAAGATRLGTSRGIDLIQNRDSLKREETDY
ncbi:deoxyribose-phosphate aldolase [Candidatus Synechococcus calcipolaris G9]|uniref:Deoxyribose-phosphate aldolase n=1 Tax=Candidatus Synechococcus calcipolaris G9 TaxID=1497997 RepID=A0ABT6EZT3_9SYNE|nr:deoxyribose-phosphate aldolase [Candidatus Synechococcus calcipolaris]MDG2991121.1 deoxyribose-phosphate aldolase [Candidatus Synechococcus calcipolaris G9]